MVCPVDAGNFVLPATAVMGSITAIIIGGTYAAGTSLSNPKLLTWAKTEAVQFFVSVFSIAIILFGVNLFCSITVTDLSQIFDIQKSTLSSLSLYEAAQNYLLDAAMFSKNALIAIRYHLEGYTVLSYFNAFICDYSTGSIGWGCLFGYGGESQQPFGGYGATTAALNVFFNSAIMGHLSIINSLFILLFIYKGFTLLFLPLGIFIRSMPYLRTLGGLFIAVSLSFLFIYPLVLSGFYLYREILTSANSNYTPSVPGVSLDNFYKEKIFTDGDSGAKSARDSLVGIGGEDAVFGKYFPSGDNPSGVILFGAYAFVASIFLPAVALLAAIASTAYLSRLYGEEIDLSRIMQLV